MVKSENALTQDGVNLNSRASLRYAGNTYSEKISFYGWWKLWRGSSWKKAS